MFSIRSGRYQLSSIICCPRQVGGMLPPAIREPAVHENIPSVSIFHGSNQNNRATQTNKPSRNPSCRLNEKNQSLNNYHSCPSIYGLSSKIFFQAATLSVRNCSAAIAPLPFRIHYFEKKPIRCFFGTGLGPVNSLIAFIIAIIWPS